MGTREKLFRQKLADQIESFLTKSERVFSSEKLSKEWLEEMLSQTQELTSKLTIYQFLHELPEDENLQLEFLELDEEISESKPEIPVPNYGDEILKEIDDFEIQNSSEVEPVEETVDEKIIEPVDEIVEDENQEDVMDANGVSPLEINETINRNPTLSDKLRKKSITKLADSIALNERFLYSNELFNGNMESFKRALNELDHIASKDDAQRYIEMQLRDEHQWNMESQIVKGFIALVERRFN